MLPVSEESWEIVKMIIRVVLIFALSAYGLSYAWRLPEWRRLFQPYIIGGEAADIKDFPYQVSLRKRGEPYGHGHICGASILDELHVLTAAHCITRPLMPNLYSIVANSTTLESGAKFDVEKIFIPDKWDSGNPYQFDVAVLKLKTPLKISESIKPVPLDPAGEEPATGTDVVVAGWGRTVPGNKIPDLDYSDLMKLHLKIVDRKSCDGCFGGTGKISGMVLCAGVEGDQKRDASLGDSGGPLVDTTTGVQVGVVSFGTDARLCPGVYTNLAVKEIREFIDKALTT